MMGVQALQDEWFSFNVNLARRARPLTAVSTDLPQTENNLLTHRMEGWIECIQLDEQAPRNGGLGRLS